MVLVDYEHYRRPDSITDWCVRIWGRKMTRAGLTTERIEEFVSCACREVEKMIVFCSTKT